MYWANRRAFIDMSMPSFVLFLFWQVANIVFLESPAFVGWSYSNRTEDRVVGDKRTARDALKFMLGFYERFPELKGRPFWIAGESYGGVCHCYSSQSV